MSDAPFGWSDLGAVLDEMREGLQVVDKAWRYLYLNRAAADHGRSPREALVGRTMMACYPGIEESEVFALMRRCMEGGGPQRMLNQFIYADGRSAWFELRIQPVPQGVAVLSIDVTEHRAIEARLAQATRLESLGRLAGGVAHDFNNLLTIINGYATFALEGLPPGSRAVEDLGQIERAAERGARLTGQLLAFSRRRPSSPEALDLCAVVSGVLEMLGRVLGDGVDVVLARDPDVPAVYLDAGSLEQIVMNLALNSRDAMGGQGVLTVELRRAVLDEAHALSRGTSVPPGVYALLVVSDTGAGLAPEVLEHIFEPFFTTKGTGTGLGLATTHGLVRQAGGYVSAYGEPGHGATFRVYLPAAGAQAALAPAARAVSLPSGRESVLVVDDDPAILEIAHRALARQGYDVRVAQTADGALAALGEGFAPALLLTDMRLEGASGADLADSARRLRPGLRVLFMSGYSELSLRACPGAMVEKPFQPGQLVQSVRAALEAEA